MSIFSQNTQTEFRKSGGLSPDTFKWKSMLIRLLLAVIAFASIMATRRYIYRYSNDIGGIESSEAFEKMYYPILDELYAAGDFENLREEIHRLRYQEGASAISKWPHLPVLHYYTRGTMVGDARTALEEGSDDLPILSDGVWAALTILFTEDHYETNENFSETDRQMIRYFRKECTALLMEDLSLTSDQITVFHDSCLYEDGSVNYDEVESYVKQYYKNDRKFTIPDR